MSGLAVAVKIALILCVLVGAGLALARVTLVGDGSDFAATRMTAQRIAAALAAVLAIASFVILVLRLGAGLNMNIASMIAKSPPGYSTALLIVGAVFVALRPTAVLGGLLMVGAFAVTGHAAAESPTDGAIIGLHVAAGAWWTGGLVLLAAVGRSPDTHSGAVELLERFSRQALVLVLLLLAAGGWIGLTLLGYSLSGLDSPYGRTLLLKVTFVVGALAIALYNRAKLTPGILEGPAGSWARLVKNARLELALIGLTAIATGVLTSSMSPPMMMG